MFVTIQWFSGMVSLVSFQYEKALEALAARTDHLAHFVQ